MATCTCGREWTGQAQAHCTVDVSVDLALSPWDGDTRVLAKRYAHLDEAPVDGAWITADLAADLVSAQSSGVKLGRPLSPSGLAVQRLMLDSGQWTQVLWTVVGPVPVDVVNVLLGRDPAIDHPVLVGLDVAPRADLPAEQDVSMAPQVPTRLVLRNLLARRKSANGSPVPGVLPSAVRASTALGVAGNSSSAVVADDGSHAWSLQVSALCHRHFSTVANFDRHKPSYAGCTDPATITNRRGEQLLKATQNRFGTTWVGAGEHPEASGDPRNPANPGMVGAA